MNNKICNYLQYDFNNYDVSHTIVNPILLFLFNNINFENLYISFLNFLISNVLHYDGSVTFFRFNNEYNLVSINSNFEMTFLNKKQLLPYFKKSTKRYCL